MLDEVVRASERAAALTRQMLAYAGKGQFLVEPLNLSDLVRDIAGLVQATIPKTVQLRLVLEDPLPAIDADGSQLHQLIMNLVINGAEAIGESRIGAVDVTTTVIDIDAVEPVPGLRQGEWRPGRYVSLEVRDNGSGMDEETQARIFDPFFTTKFTGRGLGLAAVLGIVRSHQGMIRVSSAPGAGSVFQVLFPVAKGEAFAQTPEVRREVVRLSGEITVLVVDDEEIVRRTAKETLQSYGCAVVTAENGLGALELLQVLKDRISLVLLDLTMPVMSGEERLRRLRELRPELPVILSSGYNQQDVIRRFEGNPVSGFLQEP
jgi:CheY-like chemotaxis protein